MIESWKPIIGYEDKYLISNKGRIKTVGRYIAYRVGIKATYRKGKILNPSINKCGYKHLRLYDKRDFSIHRLVAIHFVDNNNNLPCVDHIDGNKLNNNYNNLEWVSYAENNKRAYDKGLKRRIHAGQYAKGGGRL